MASSAASMGCGYIQQTFTNGSIQLGPRHARSSFIPRVSSSSFFTMMWIIRMLFPRGLGFGEKLGFF